MDRQITDKLGKRAKETINSEFSDISSAITSSIVSIFISSETIKVDGVLGVVFQVALFVLLWLGFSICVFYPLSRRIRIYFDVKDARKQSIGKPLANQYINDFKNNTWCQLNNAVLFLKWINCHVDTDEFIKKEYLENSFDSFAIALQNTCNIVKNHKICVNSADNALGVSYSHIVNTYHYLESVYKSIGEVHNKIPISDVFQNEYILALQRLKSISEYIKTHASN